MPHRRATPLRFRGRALQFEIPSGLAVRGADQHHPVFVLQTHGLLFDYFGILPDESRPKNIHDEGYDGEPRQNIPGRIKIQTAQIVPNRRYRRSAGEPIFPRANLFEALIGQHEIDHGGSRLAGEQFQYFVGRAVCRWSVRTHPESIWNRLELLRFFANTSPAAPPPRLMHEWPVR